MLPAVLNAYRCSLRAPSPLRFSLQAVALQQRRGIASRFPEKSPGSGRAKVGRRSPNLVQEDSSRNILWSERDPTARSGQPLEEEPTAQQSPLWEASQARPLGNPTEGLSRLLANDTLIVTRQIEMLNIFLDFEQTNRYAIQNIDGETVGYIAEEQRSFLSIMSRQVFRTHRPFRAIIMDTDGTPVLWLRRPFQWINSRMYIQRLQDGYEYTPDGEPVLDTFAEVQQRWHFYRRRYDLFIREKATPIISLATERQPEPDLAHFNQFAQVDGGFLAWNFILQGARGEEIASIDRKFRGVGREILTDTGQYVVRFSPSTDNLESDVPRKPTVMRDLTIDERASILALAVNIDFDYFSRHSGSGPGIGWLWLAAAAE